MGSTRLIRQLVPQRVMRDARCRTEAREQLRRQVGTLRFDLNTLAETKPKADKKKALELKKDFIANVRERRLHRACTPAC